LPPNKKPLQQNGEYRENQKEGDPPFGKASSQMLLLSTCLPESIVSNCIWKNQEKRSCKRSKKDKAKTDPKYPDKFQSNT
jgi:hypothetical protein